MRDHGVDLGLAQVEAGHQGGVTVNDLGVRATDRPGALTVAIARPDLDRRVLHRGGRYLGRVAGGLVGPVDIYVTCYGALERGRGTPPPGSPDGRSARAGTSRRIAATPLV